MGDGESGKGAVGVEVAMVGAESANGGGGAGPEHPELPELPELPLAVKSHCLRVSIAISRSVSSCSKVLR